MEIDPELFRPITDLEGRVCDDCKEPLENSTGIAFVALKDTSCTEEGKYYKPGCITQYMGESTTPR